MARAWYGVGALVGKTNIPTPEYDLTRCMVFASSARDAQKTASCRLRKKFPIADGWDALFLTSLRIDRDLLDRAQVEQSWFDKTGARRLYLGLIVAVKERNGERTTFLEIFVFLSQCDDLAQDTIEELASANFPAAEGYEVEQAAAWRTSDPA